MIAILILWLSMNPNDSEQTISMSNRAGGHQPVIVCKSPDGTWRKAHSCVITKGHDLDEIVLSFIAIMEEPCTEEIKDSGVLVK